MVKNPYVYKGPLNITQNKLVIVPRKTDVKKVTDGIRKGEYWAILGIRQIGKTTFLRQIIKRLKKEHHVYINCEVTPKDEKKFYLWIMKKILEQVPLKENSKIINKWKNYTPPFMFIKFLENLKIEDDKNRIIIFLDEIEGIPFLSIFLSVLRTIHQERNDNKHLKKFSFVIAGSVGLMASTIGGNYSAFNSAEIYYIKDFSISESEQLIDKPFTRLKIKIESETKKKLISMISGHPQMLQQACYQLVEIARNENRIIVEKDVNDTINFLLEYNTTIDTLKQDIQKNKTLEDLVKDILKGKSKKYFNFKEFSITGAGCIIGDENSFCTIRNRIYEEFLRDNLDINTTDQSIDTEINNLYEEKSTKKNLTDKYRIIKTIGIGGMGKVIKAEDLILNRPVAIKILNKELYKKRNLLERFKKEACLPAQLSHPNIVTIFEFIVKADDYQMVMEFIDGKNLKDMITAGGPLTSLQLIYIAKKISEAVAHLHKHKIIHRDIKPKNIVLTREGKIKLVDFGVAVIQEGKPTGETGIIMGTPQYMAPEQFFGNPPHFISDIYSIGITLFYLATGKVPFDGQKIEDVRDRHIKDPLPPITEYRKNLEDIERIIKKCAEKEPEKRFQSARELLETLNSKWESLDEAAIEKELIKRIGE